MIFKFQGCTTEQGEVHAPETHASRLGAVEYDQLPLSNVLLPAVIISSAVFSTLTLPFAFINKEPVAVELPFYTGEIQPIFNGEHKTLQFPMSDLPSSSAWEQALPASR
jgi:hypothetical protein